MSSKTRQNSRTEWIFEQSIKSEETKKTYLRILKKYKKFVGVETIIPAEWKIINISGNAEKAHVEKHTDGESFDGKISDEFTVEDCLARNIVTEPEVPDPIATTG